MFWSKLFGADKPAPPQSENVKLLCSIESAEELAVMRSLLDSANIPYLMRDRGAGEIIRIIAGSNSVFTCDIYVADEQYEEAKALIEADFSDEETVYYDLPESLPDEEPEKGSEDL